MSILSFIGLYCKEPKTYLHHIRRVVNNPYGSELLTEAFRQTCPQASSINLIYLSAIYCAISLLTPEPAVSFLTLEIRATVAGVVNHGFPSRQIRHGCPLSPLLCGRSLSVNDGGVGLAGRQLYQQTLRSFLSQ